MSGYFFVRHAGRKIILNFTNKIEIKNVSRGI